MKLLLLGGPKFLGRALIDSGLQRGHRLTVFNRGVTNPDLYPEVEKLRGDREGNLEALRNREWDAVIDTCGYVPRLVTATAGLLAASVERYTFISSLSVYAQTRTPGIDESGAVGRLEDETAEEITGETYGPLKVLCELAVERAFPGRALQVRAGLIVGPFDPSDRFTYWPWRVSRGGSVLAPGKPATPVQFVDVRDLAEWIIRMVEQSRAGVYNATGPEKSMTMGALLEACRAVSKGQTELVWVEEGFLLQAGVAPWSELPLWIPESDPDSAGFSAFDSSKAITAGLSFRSVAATVRDTLAWAATRPSDWQWRAGLDPDRETELLSRWQGRSDNMVE